MIETAKIEECGRNGLSFSNEKWRTYIGFQTEELINKIAENNVEYDLISKARRISSNAK